MARTLEGKQLTEAHRRSQIILRGNIEETVRRATLEGVNLDDISGSWRWRLAMMDTMRTGFTTSATLAGDYLPRFQAAEGGKILDLVVPEFDPYVADEIINDAGIANMKKRIGKGVAPESALAQTSRTLATQAAQFAMSAGRGLVTGTVKYHGKSGRWRRVTDGKPCAFCGMLAGRGPVYAEDTVQFRSHGHCGCTSEQVIGDWEPTDAEAAWRAAYQEAASEADDHKLARTAPSPGSDAEDNILWRMRRNHPDLFHDGVKDTDLSLKLPARPPRRPGPHGSAKLFR